MALNNYFDFADNDYRYFIASYQGGLVANMMAAMAQGICEKYVKHIISEFYIPQTQPESDRLAKVMHTHSLNTLMKFAKAKCDVEFSEEARREMKIIDGFYFSARYPGDDSVEVDKEDIEHCFAAISMCRSETLDIIERLQKSIDDILDDANGRTNYCVPDTVPVKDDLDL